MRRFFTLCRIELKLALRSPDVIIFALAMPIVVMVISAILSGTPDGPRLMVTDNLGAYLAIGICAIGLMSLPLTLADYRHKGVLKRLQVTPVHPGSLLIVQGCVQALIAALSALLVLLTSGLLFGVTVQGSPLQLFSAFLLVLLAIFSIGMCIASTSRDIQRAGIACTLIYFPMLLFSGTTIPFDRFPRALQLAAQVLPLRQGVILLQGIASGRGIGSYLFELLMLMSVTIVCGIIAVRSFRWDMTKGT